MKAVLLASAMCVALALAGCGGSGGHSTGSTEASIGTIQKEKPRDVLREPPHVAASSLLPRKAKPHIVLPKGPPPKKKVIVRDLEKGIGAVAKTGDLLTVDFDGVYYDTGQTTDSSWKTGAYDTFRLGSGKGILGWEKALQGMRVGGRRELIIPSRLTSRYLPPSQERPQIYVIDLRKIGRAAMAPSQ